MGNMQSNPLKIEVPGVGEVSALWQAPVRATACLVLAHGAGAGMTRRSTSLMRFSSRMTSREAASAKAARQTVMYGGGGDGAFTLGDADLVQSAHNIADGVDARYGCFLMVAHAHATILVQIHAEAAD